MNRETKKEGFSRREFLISLGAGTTLAIAGFFTFDILRERTDEQSAYDCSDKPALSEQVRLSFQNSQLVLHGEGTECFVNKTGEKVITLLDGKNTLPRIAAAISDYYAIAHTGYLEASIASFICQLGSQGFLSSPYYVTIYETS